LSDGLLERRILVWMGMLRRRTRGRKVPFTRIGFVLVAVLCPLVTGQVSERATTPDSRDGYVGSQTCAQCHGGIYKQFSATHMGRSLATVSPALLDALGTPLGSMPSSTYDAKMDRHFEVSTRDGKLYQSEFQTGQGGKEIFRDTRQIHWIIGSGMNGFGGIVERDGYLFQGPLSFYSKANHWAVSPGYEFVDFGFSRPILAGCIACHSGRPSPIAATNGRYADPPFAEMAIGCENCHGPGASHVQAIKHPVHGAKGYPFIVNPAQLTPELANNICMSCHQAGDLRILKAGKEYSDFRPGKPLDDTLSILMVPPDRAEPPQEDHLEHYYSMTLSKCYRASNGRLACISCHDPHVEPAKAEASAYFKQKCLTCHTEKSCSLPIAERQRSSPPDDCAGCHMPKRDVTEIRHASITNHRILARQGEPFPAEAFQQTTAALPDLIHLNPAPGQNSVAPPPLTLLQAYGELAANKPEYSARYFALLDQLEHTEPGSALVQAALGRRDLLNGKLQAAVEHLQLAVKIGPPQASVYGDLSEALAKSGRTEEALPLLQKAIELDPFNPVLQKTLVLRYIQQKQYPSAKAALEHYLEVFPQDSFMRHLLDMASQGGMPQ
jgi:tetratricopeptide repeat protein